MIERITRYYCDRCGKQMEVLTYAGEYKVTRTFDSQNKEVVDLCEDCLMHRDILISLYHKGKTINIED